MDTSITKIASTERITAKANFDELFGIIIPNGEVLDGFKVLGTCAIASGQASVHIVERDGKKYALKLYQEGKSVIDKAVIKALEKVDCPHVIKIVATGSYKGLFYTVTPYYEGGSVNDHLEEIDPVLLKTRYIPQLNEALNALHMAGIFHCDIKPHNIFLDADGQNVVIGDLGVSLATSNNEVKTSIRGEYISKRTLGIKEETTAYLSVEGDEYAASWVDYFALGMTILNMSHRGDIYKDVDNETIRDELVNNPIRISDNVDNEIAMLVLKLLTKDQLDRIGYKEVKSWCEDTSIYGKFHRDSDSHCKIRVKGVKFNGALYNSTEELTEALMGSWDAGLEYYRSGKLYEALSSARRPDEATLAEVARIKSAYTKDKEEIGFILTLLEINPELRLRYRDQIFGDFKGYIKYCCDNIHKISSCFFNEAVLIKQLQNEGLIKRVNVSELIRLVQRICASSAYTGTGKLEMMLSFFSEENAIYFRGKRLEKISDLAWLMFDDKFIPYDNNDIFNELFLELLTTKSEELSMEKLTLAKLFRERSKVKRNASLAIFLTGQAPLMLQGFEIRDMAGVVDYVKDLVEKKKDPTVLYDAIRGGTLYYYCISFKETDVDPMLKALVIDLKGGINVRKLTAEQAAREFYNKTQSIKVFTFKGEVIESMATLINKLGRSTSIELDTKELMESAEFKEWLKEKGYTYIASKIK